MKVSLGRKTAWSAAAAVAVGAVFGITCTEGVGFCAVHPHHGAYTSAAREEISWEPSLQQAFARAKRTQTPVMVDFYATWCPPCKMLATQTYTDSRVVSAAHSWITAHVDVDKERPLASKYGIQSLPTVAFFRPDGSAVGAFEGYVGPDEMLKVLQKVLVLSKRPAESPAPSASGRRA